MTDISIGKVSKNSGLNKSDSAKGEFAVLKKEYNSFMKKMAKSDMSNSPVMKEKELSLLEQLKVLAEKESCSQELEWIDAKLEELKKSLCAEKPLAKAVYYPPTSFKGSSVDKSIGQDLSVVLQLYTNEDGVVDKNVQRIADSFDSDDIDAYALSGILKKCVDDNGVVTDNIASAVEILGKSGVKPVSVTQMLEEFSLENQDGTDSVDLEMCSNIASFKAAGIEDFDALKFVKFINENFENKAVVESQIKKMQKVDISSDATIKILNALSVKNPETSQKIISDSAVQSVVSLKKAMSSTRNNEKAERDNPINLLGVLMLKMGDDVMVMKGNKITYVSPVEGKTVHDLKKEYDEMVSKLEDSLLLEYVQKYKDKNGEIDSKYLRTMTVLRNKGIPYDQLFNMTDFCVNDNGIDSQKLNAIAKIKSSGALGVDVLPILEAVEQTPDGKYSEEDIKNACALSSAVIGGKELIALLPEVRGKENVKEFFEYFSQLFEDKSNLIQILSLIKDEEGNIDENAMDVLYGLAHNFFVSADGAMSESDFMKNANDIVYAAMDKDGIRVNDEGAGICSIMCQNKQGPKEILIGLEKCKDLNGKIDEKLSEILWDLSVRQAHISDIEYILDFCRKETGEINYTMADNIISLMEEGYSKDDVIEFAMNTH